MKDMWKTVKQYFGDGFIQDSAPLRFNVHYCTLKRPIVKTDKIRLGVTIDEDATPMFSALGDTCAPPCTCQDVPALVKHIDHFLETFTGDHPADYDIATEKGDGTLDEVALYAMRDCVSWWVHTGGALHPRHYWKQIYLGFATISDDVQIPPRDLVDGTFRFLGHTWPECLAGLRAEGVKPDLVKFAEMCIWRQTICQYLEKVDPGLRPLLVSKTSVMTQYRVMTANTLGCVALLLAVEEPVAQPLTDHALEMASVSHCLSLDIAKECLGVLQGEKTESVAGDRAQLKRELRWIYMRCLDYLDAQPNEHIRRYASAGLVYVPMMDRYRERVRGNIRFPLSEAMGRILEPFVKPRGFPTHTV
ncbi:hypothetical protein JDV02_006409 [Purpureocillium takamizusanense]|uniref:Uncharacterized protein n=1 Tax=Purpureocillium takamizusanense TaxID=2060973 RepID=A0A9Q8QK69_9HYPO|nr:uncharacterized protein JDV02_006409 [Purpureocillium takamizusanense]UNI20309.1 hypothetical protein JDV02_006409 [Purpureocillium takamizusanense]